MGIAKEAVDIMAKEKWLVYFALLWGISFVVLAIYVLG
jgi:hypothetical protein